MSNLKPSAVFNCCTSDSWLGCYRTKRTAASFLSFFLRLLHSFDHTTNPVQTMCNIKTQLHVQKELLLNFLFFFCSFLFSISSKCGKSGFAGDSRQFFFWADPSPGWRNMWRAPETENSCQFCSSLTTITWAAKSFQQPVSVLSRKKNGFLFHVFFVVRCFFLFSVLSFLSTLPMKLLPFSFSVMVCLYVLAPLSITFSPATDFIANIFFFASLSLWSHFSFISFSFLFFCSLNNILTTLPIENIGDIPGLCENIFPLDDQHPSSFS